MHIWFSVVIIEIQIVKKMRILFFLLIEQKKEVKFILWEILNLPLAKSRPNSILKRSILKRWLLYKNFHIYEFLPSETWWLIFLVLFSPIIKYHVNFKLLFLNIFFLIYLTNTMSLVPYIDDLNIYPLLKISRYFFFFLLHL